MRDFASRSRPLRMSSIPMLFRCSLRGVLLHGGVIFDESGPAAHTGSIFHAGMAAFHNREDTDAALNAALATFRQGSIHEARRMLHRYSSDPRNATAEVIAVERPVSLKLPPWPTDPTGQTIYLTGTLDQIRRAPDGTLAVWDAKTSRRDQLTTLHNSLYQLCGYAVAASKLLRREVDPGGIIYIRGYLARNAASEAAPQGVFIPSGLTLADAKTLMEHVRRLVAAIRRGEYAPSPGDHCGYCPAVSPAACISLTVINKNRKKKTHNGNECTDEATRQAVAGLAGIRNPFADA